MRNPVSRTPRLTPYPSRSFADCSCKDRGIEHCQLLPRRLSQLPGSSPESTTHRLIAPSWNSELLLRNRHAFNGISLSIGPSLRTLENFPGKQIRRFPKCNQFQLGNST